MDKVEASVATKSGDEITVSSLNFSSSTIPEQTSDSGPETEPLRKNSLFASETASNELESVRNVCAN